MRRRGEGSSVHDELQALDELELKWVLRQFPSVSKPWDPRGAPSALLVPATAPVCSVLAGRGVMAAQKRRPSVVLVAMSAAGAPVKAVDRWLLLTAQFEIAVAAQFANLGRRIVKWPYLTILITFALACALITGVGAMRVETGIAELWVPQDSEAAVNSRSYEKLWNSEAASYYVLVTVKGAPAGGETIFTKPALTELATLYDAIMSMEVVDANRTFTYRDVCSRPSPIFPHVCFMFSALDVWKDEASFDACLAGSDARDCDYAVNASRISDNPVADVRAAAPTKSWINTDQHAKVLPVPVLDLAELRLAELRLRRSKRRVPMVHGG